MAVENIYSDADLRGCVSVKEAVAVMREAFLAAADGALVAPARHVLRVGQGGLVFTMGGESVRRQVAGFRVYDSVAPNAAEHVQLVVVYDSRTGAFKGAIAGRWIGDLRTGAIGGVAVDALAGADARVLAVVGTGNQARTQLPAAASVRSFEQIGVYSRDPGRRERFAREMTETVGQSVLPARSVREAVENADVVISSTTSTEPVVQADWIKPGAHVNLVGPKFCDGCELDVAILERVSLFATDSAAQAESMGARFLLAGSPYGNRLVELSEVVAGKHAGRTSNDAITLFISLGLAGTEVLLADLVLNRAAQAG